MVKKPFRVRLNRAFQRDKYLYLIFLLPLAYFVVFEYMPMYGIIIAFKDIRVFRDIHSILDAPFNNFAYFKEFLSDSYFYKLLRNTFLISLYQLLFSFPAPIILAFMLNEVRNGKFKRVIQTITYLPHFISTVVICGMLISFLSTSGMVNQLVKFFGGEAVQFLTKYQYFRTIYVASGIWQSVGWGSIIYLAALSAIDVELYEAAKIDGANRLAQALYITLPGIAPTISIHLIMNIGSMLNVGYQKIILLYNGTTYETADVISTYVYRRGLVGGQFSYATSVGLFMTVVNLVFLVLSNSVAKKLQSATLW